jgi:PPOX class probable F420-dependent enzyme
MHRDPTDDPLERLEGWERELLEGARVAHLGLVDARDRPRVLPVTFAVAAGSIWSAIDDKPKRAGIEPARVRYLRRRPHAAVTVDRYDDEWSRLAWIQVLGVVSILELAVAREGIAALGAKYPQYRERQPPGPVLRLDPRRTISWRAAVAAA